MLGLACMSVPVKLCFVSIHSMWVWFEGGVGLTQHSLTLSSQLRALLPLWIPSGPKLSLPVTVMQLSQWVECESSVSDVLAYSRKCDVKQSEVREKFSGLALKQVWERDLFYFCLFFPRRGVGRSRKYCNTGPTRGESGASPWHLTCVQKSV